MYVQYLNEQKHNKNNNENTLRKMTFTPLQRLLKIFGLTCVSSNGKKLKYSWPTWKVAFTTTAFFIANCMSIYCLMTVTYNRAKATFQDYIPVIYSLGYVQYIVDLTFVHRYGRQRCLNYYNTFASIDKVIGMPYYNEIRKSVAKIFIFYILIGSCYVTSDYSALVISHGWLISTMHSIDYIYAFIKMLSALDGIAHCTQVKFRLKRMEDILREYYSSVASLPGETKDVICKRIVKTNQTVNVLDSLNTIGHNRPGVILQLSRCYILLLEQCDYINGFFGFRVLLGGLVYLMEMVMLSNLLVKLAIGTMVPFYESGIFPLASTVMKIVNYSSVLLWGISCCEQTYKQTDKIVRCIDHLLVNKKLTIEADEALKELRGLITTRAVTFSAVNFYTLDYPAMLSMASAVVTYTIILLQNLQ